MQVLRLSTSKDGKELHEALDAIEGVALRMGLVASPEEIELAMHLTEKAFANKTNIARSRRLEFLLWICGKTDIKSAMESSSTRKGEDFLVVVFSDIKTGEIAEKLKAKALPLGLATKANPLALERISLSRVK